MDRSQLTALYEAYGYAVHRRCLRILASPAEADDALQEVFLRVMRYGATHRGDHPLPWLYRIAERVCFDQLRRRKRRTDREVATERSELGRSEGTPPVDRQLVARVLSSCDRRVQEVAVLYFVDEMTQEEIAVELGCSRKVVRRRLERFRDKARRAGAERLAQEIEP